MVNCKGKINLRENKVYDKCSNTCNFKYDYKTSPSTCRIKSKGIGRNKNKSNYLDIKCFDGNNEISYSSVGNIEISDVRLYCPSLNKWNGRREEAELILHHVGNGKHIYVCIPVVRGGKDGRSPDWFKRLQLNSLPARTGAESNPTAANFKLDDVIPQGSYYVMKNNGMKFDSNCIPGNNITLIFSNENPAFIGEPELELLKQRVHTKADGHHTVSTGEIIYNEIGTRHTGGGGESGGQYGDIMESECYQITDEDGNAILDDDGKPWDGTSPDWVKSVFKIQWKEKFWAYVEEYWWIVAFLPAIAFIILVPQLGLPQKLARTIQGFFNKKPPKHRNTSLESTSNNTPGIAKKIDVISKITKNK